MLESKAEVLLAPVVKRPVPQTTGRSKATGAPGTFSLITKKIVASIPNNGGEPPGEFRTMERQIAKLIRGSPQLISRL